MRKPNKDKMVGVNLRFARSVQSIFNGFLLKMLLRSLPVYILKQLLFSISVVSFAAVFRLVTQRSSPQMAAFFRNTFLPLCLSVQAIDQSYHNDCLQSNQSNCSKKTFPRIWNVDQRKSVRSFYSSVWARTHWANLCLFCQKICHHLP